MLYRWKQFQVVRDDCFKFLLLPDADSRGMASRADEAVKAAHARGEGTPFTNLLPAIHAATYAQFRIDAASEFTSNRGSIACTPLSVAGSQEKLDDIKAVPVPNDPFTEKPFEYVVKDGVAIIHRCPMDRGERTRRDPGRNGLN